MAKQTIEVTLSGEVDVPEADLVLEARITRMEKRLDEIGVLLGHILRIVSIQLPPAPTLTAPEIS